MHFSLGLTCVVLLFVSVGPNSHVCLTKSCIKTAAMFCSNLDPQIDPCRDFYRFACGKFEEKNSLYESIDAIKLEALRHNAELRDLMKQVVYSYSNDEEMHSLVLFHTSCMNARFDESSVLPVLRKIADWPVISDDFDEDSFDWVDYNNKLINNGALSSALIQLGINAGDDSPSFSVKSFKISLFNLSHHLSSSLNETLEIISRLNETMENSFSSITSDVLLNVTLLAKQLAMRNTCSNANEDTTITISDLYNVSDRIDWLQFINNQLSPHNATLNGSIRIDRCSYSILSDVFSILDSTPSRTVATFMMLRTFTLLLSELDFYNVPYKQIDAQKSARLKKCIHTELTYFPVQIFKLYVDKYISEEVKAEVTKTMTKLHGFLLRTVVKANWMMSETRRKLENMIKAIRSHLFLTENYGKLIRKFDSMINMSGDDLLSNLLQLNRARFTLRMQKMQNSEIDYLFHMALYRYNIRSLSAHLYVNFVGVSPSFFNGKFFAVDRPTALNYGSLGFIFGHELVHSIDKYFFDLTSISKQDRNSYDFFQKKLNCIVNKLGKYYSVDLKIKHRGKISLNEDLADIEGAGLAYKAYNMKYGQKIETVLPGLNFTGNQLFWIQLANMFCRFDNTYQWQGMRNDTHSHNKFRIWAIVSNSVEFARDFSCPIGTPMNPEEKCRIWV